MKCILIFAFFTVALAVVRFDGDQVLTLFPSTSGHIDLIKKINSDIELDFWNPDSIDGVQVGRPVDIRFKRINLLVVKHKLEQANLPFTVKINDVQYLIDNQFDMRETRHEDGEHPYDEYHTYDEILDWTNDMVIEHSEYVTREILAISEEGRDIPMLTITNSPSSNNIVLIDCGIHAREWISPAFCQWFAHELIVSSNSAITELKNHLKFVIIPVLNVDGYAYTWTNDRMWRKTRSTSSNSICVGVDPNRNFDANFGGPGSSGSPCSDTYRGPFVESEQLTTGLSNYIRDNVGSIKAYLTFHSYGQYMLYPYSYDYTSVANNAQELDDLAASATAALTAVHGKTYTYGPGAEVLYAAAGGSDDFALDEGATLSYTIELRDNGRYGFELPESLILATCEETIELVRVVCEYVIDTYV